MALMKAVRGAEISMDTLNRCPTDERRCSKRGCTTWTTGGCSPCSRRSKAGIDVDAHPSSSRSIDRWFLRKLKQLADFEAALPTA